MNYKIFLNGRQHESLQENFLSLRARDELGLRSDSVTLNFVWDPTLPKFESGHLVNIWLGDELDNVGVLDRFRPRKQYEEEIGTYYISEVSLRGRPHEIKVKCLSSPLILEKSLRNSHQRSWQHGKKRLSQIMTEIADGAGLKLEYTHDEDPLTHAIYQSIEQDHELLTRLAKERDLSFKVVESRIIVFKIGSEHDTQNRPVKPVEIRENEQMSYDFVRENVEAWDGCRARVQNVRAGRPTEFTFGFTDGDRRAVYQFKETFSDVKVAEDAMRTKLRESRRTEKQVTLNLAPIPGIVAGGKVILKGFPDEIDDKYLVDRAVHRFHSKGGYKIKADLLLDVEDIPIEVNERVIEFPTLPAKKN